MILIRYLGVTAELRRRIRGGQYPVGSCLPRQMDLATDLGVSATTVGKAVRVLEAERLVRAVPGVGTVVLLAGRITVRADLGDGHRLDQNWLDLEVRQSREPPPASFGGTSASPQGVAYRVGVQRVEQLATVWQRGPSDRWSQRVYVRLADEDEARSLGIDPRSPVLCLERVGTHDGTTSCVMLLVLSDRYELVVPIVAGIDLCQ